MGVGLRRRTLACLAARAYRRLGCTGLWGGTLVRGKARGGGVVQGDVWSVAVIRWALRRGGEAGRVVGCGWCVALGRWCGVACGSRASEGGRRARGRPATRGEREGCLGRLCFSLRENELQYVGDLFHATQRQGTPPERQEVSLVQEERGVR